MIRISLSLAQFIELYMSAYGFLKDSSFCKSNDKHALNPYKYASGATPITESSKSLSLAAMIPAQ